MEGKLEGFLTRHSKKPKGDDKESQQYPGISDVGVEMSEKRAEEEISKMIEQAEPGSLIFLAGASEQVRTKSTAEVYGDKLKELFAGREDIKVVTREEISEMRDPQRGATFNVENLKNYALSDPDKKVVIDFPLFLKEFALSGDGRWANKNGEYSEYTKAILKKHNNDELACLREWVETEGKMGDITGPNPTQVAEEQLNGMKRLNQFAQKYADGRPVLIGGTGHSWNLDALAIYLANEGKVNIEGLEKIGNSMIKETELMKIEIKDGKEVFGYRGQEFEVKNN
jgi:hypothetical protein